MIDMCYAAGQVSYYISGAQGVGLHTLMHSVEVEADKKAGNSAKRQNWKFSKTAKLEIQQKRKFKKKKKKLENWIFNNSGFITKTTKQESYEAASDVQKSRNSGKQ